MLRIIRRAQKRHKTGVAESGGLEMAELVLQPGDKRWVHIMFFPRGPSAYRPLVVPGSPGW